MSCISAVLKLTVKKNTSSYSDKVEVIIKQYIDELYFLVVLNIILELCFISKFTNHNCYSVAQNVDTLGGWR